MKKRIWIPIISLTVVLVLIGATAVLIINSRAEEAASCPNCAKIGDLDGNGTIDIDDALYTLRHVYFPEYYPLPRCAEHSGTNPVDPLPTEPSPGNPESPSTMTKEKYGYFSYWLYTPKNATEGMPMIVYLHGGSGKGDDPELITAVDGFPKYLQDGDLGEIPAYVIIPQLPSTDKGWSSVKNQLLSLINGCINKYSVDTERVSLTGHSMGGTGAWSIALASPETFCAVAALSGSVKVTDENITVLSKIPIWGIVGDEDTIVEPDATVDFINALSEVNPNTTLTILEGYDHFQVPTIYKDESFGLIEFLLQQ